MDWFRAVPFAGGAFFKVLWGDENIMIKLMGGIVIGDWSVVQTSIGDWLKSFWFRESSKITKSSTKN